MPDITTPDSIPDRPTPDAEQPLPSVETSLTRIVEQLETVIYLLRKPERDEAERQRKAEQTAEAYKNALGNYNPAYPDE